MKKLIVYTDGGSRGNPGPSAIGAAVYLPASRQGGKALQAGNEKEQLIKEYSEYIGEGTNNEAEYQAVIFALKKIKHLFGKKKIKELDIEIKSDSEFLVKQVQGKYKVLEPRIQSLFLQIWNLKIDFGKITFFHIPREENKKADALANEALDKEFSVDRLL
ncbi:ribonuclease HI family protein [Candidatus Parcubacteria bacterium]|nr:ribonuclease HI family protein [Candidatus Parcubacteria bacterium]